MIKIFAGTALLTLVLLLLSSCSSAEDAKSPQVINVGLQPQARPAEPPEEELAGEFFGVPVPAHNFYFAMRTALTFGTPWGGVPDDEKELEKRIWDDLILSYEAFRRNVGVSKEELEEEINDTLKGHRVGFDWKKDRREYADWVKEKMNAPVELFENQLRHLVQLKKLYQEIHDAADPEISEEEALGAFRDEYNSLSVELIRFDDLDEANAFYEKLQAAPGLWDEEAEKDKDKERKDQKIRRPGFVSLQFLMHMWKFPRKACYEMVKAEPGSFYPPAPIYKGYGIFKIIETRHVTDRADFDKRTEYYYDRIRARKKWRAFRKWLDDLHKEANIKKYMKPPEGLFEPAEERQVEQKQEE